MARLKVRETSKSAAGIRHQQMVARFARTGYIAKGITYLLMGLLAMRAAFGHGAAAGTTRAISILDNGIAGRAALLVIGLGLGAYALWKLYEAIADPEDDPWHLRVGSAFVGLVNGGIAVQAVIFAWTSVNDSGARDDTSRWSGVALQFPLGVWIVGAAGLCFAGYGLWQIYRGAVSKLDSQLRLGRMDAGQRGPAVLASRFGIVARGFVFVLIGIFVVQAALRTDPSEARDFGRSLQRLAQQPFGGWLLGAVALGLLAYAAYEFLRARYRRIPAAE